MAINADKNKSDQQITPHCFNLKINEEQIKEVRNGFINLGQIITEDLYCDIEMNVRIRLIVRREIKLLLQKSVPFNLFKHIVSSCVFGR